MSFTAWERSNLLFENKLLKDKVASFESGKKYVQMQEEFRKVHGAELRTIRKLEAELSAAHAEIIRVRELWYGTCEDVISECNKKLAAKDRIIQELEQKLAEAHCQRDAEHERYRQKVQECYKAAGELEEEQEKNAALIARINKDFSNSSKSSSLSPNHKTIHNSRQKSGKKPGGQPGHEHHERTRHEPTRTIRIRAPKKYTQDPNFKPTGRDIKKQLIRLHVSAEVIEYITKEYRNQTTGQRVHAAFPFGLTDEITYDESVKAFAYLVNNGLYTSIDKTRVFLKEISHGEIAVSNGFICKLSKEFSEKTESERNKIFLEMTTADVLHGDFTFGRVNGKNAAVIITATENGVLFQERKKKGDEGVKDSPLEFYEGTLVSDHESALIKHGSRHQECIFHVQRYAKGSAENEPERKWAQQLAGWIKESNDYWSDVHDEIEPYDKEKAEAYISRLKEILELAKEEYEYEPPSKYYREGYNLFKRMYENIEEYVLFLRDPSVPPHNNRAERSARLVKRKVHQVMSFRSHDGFRFFCDGLTILESAKARNENVYDALCKRFRRPCRP